METEHCCSRGHFPLSDETDRLSRGHQQRHLHANGWTERHWLGFPMRHITYSAVGAESCLTPHNGPFLVVLAYQVRSFFRAKSRGDRAALFRCSFFRSCVIVLAGGAGDCFFSPYFSSFGPCSLVFFSSSSSVHLHMFANFLFLGGGRLLATAGRPDNRLSFPAQYPPAIRYCVARQGPFLFMLRDC